MAGTTISTTLTHTVTLSGAYASPLTIATSGAIEPGLYTGTALYVPQKGTLVSVVNHGIIAAGRARYGYAGFAGYRAIDLDSGTALTNTDEIIGGTGGEAGSTGGLGGIGIDIRAFSTVVNSGDILGGAGGYAVGEGVGGHGGIGVYFATASTLTNSGVIEGGTGGSSYRISSLGEAGGGTGVSTSSEGFINNTGFIFGGDGAAARQFSDDAGSGGDGVVLGLGGSITNGGTIFGGLGGGYNAQTEIGGPGGAGMSFTGATGSNAGLVEGGGGGGGGFGGAGGSGVYVNQYGSFTNSGRVIGGVGGEVDNAYGGGGAGGDGVVMSSGGAVTNSGQISGGAGGYAPLYSGGGTGGDGVFLFAGNLTNRGTITGGAGGVSRGDGGNHINDFLSSGNGGLGVIIYGGSATNYGVIHGGYGGTMSGQGGHAGAGGYGVSVFGDATFINHGTVIGGAGGSTGQAAYNYGYGGTGGVGLLINAGTMVMNTGTIIGGTGGSNIYDGVAGGAGVEIVNGGTFVDSGVVRGGAGGVSQGAGPAGNAILFAGTVAGTLVLNPGASFTGLVTGEGSDINVLELAGVSTATLSGVGSEFTDFHLVSFATGAQRVVEGSLSSLDTIAGFAPHDTIVLDNFTATLANTRVSLSSIAFSSGPDAQIILSQSSAKDVLIADGGGKTTISAVGTTATTIAASAEQFVLFGGTATGSKINAGGTVQVESGGIAAAATISGGTLLLDVGGHISSGATFSTVTGGKLIIDSATMPSSTISGFIAGDTIKLAGVVYNPNDTVTVLTAGVVTVNAPGTAYKLAIAGATVGETDFRFGAGSVLTKTAAPNAMAFLAPETLTAASWLSALPAPGFADLFGGSLQAVAPASGQGFAEPAAQPDPPLVHGIGFGAFTISDNVRLEMGAIHHAGPI